MPFSGEACQGLLWISVTGELMSIADLAAAGFSGCVMDYEEGGKICVWRWNGREIRLPANCSMAQVQEALRSDLAKLEGDDVG